MPPKAFPTPGPATPRLAAAFVAGGLAIALNMALLWGADRIGVTTAHGGLLRLLRLLLEMASPDSVHPALGALLGWPGFQAGFHVFVGLGMAAAYAYVVAPLSPRRPLLTSLTYAAAVWALNAAVVLPVTGEGFAGERHLGLAGIAAFAIAHTVFFVLLGVLYPLLRRAD